MYIDKNSIITIASGHYPLQGASKYGNETKLARELVLKLIAMLNEKGYKVKDCTPPNGSYSINSQLQKEVALANSYNSKLHLCIHFNAGGGEGTEQWIYACGGNAEQYAKQLQSEMIKATGYKDRGVKVSGNKLYIPRKTNAPCVLMEIAFVDSKGDMDKYNVEVVANAIFKAITGVAYDGTTINATEPKAETKATEPKIIQCDKYSDYNAVLSGDDFYIRNENKVKTGEILPKGTQVKVLDISYSKQLCYVMFMSNGKERICYISNVPSCISYLYENQYANGSTEEPVYEESNCVNKIGSLDRYEKATVLYRENGILHIVYDTDKGRHTKSGFVKYNGGFSGF